MGPSAEPKPGMFSRLKGGLSRFFVPFDDLMGRQPVNGPGTPSLTEWHAPTRDALRQMRPLDRIAAQQALESVTNKAKMLKGPADNDLFLKTLWNRELLATATTGGDSYSLPGFTREEAVAMAQQTQAALQYHLEQSPHVAEAVEAAFQTNRELGQQLADRGLIPKDFRPDYLHHLILRHVNDALDGRGAMTPSIRNALRQGETEGPPGIKQRNPGSLKERSKGMVSDINRDYWTLQYQYERAIRSAIKAYDGIQGVVNNSDLRFRPKPGMEQARAAFLQEGILPPGYVKWNMRSGFMSLSGRNPAEILFGEHLDGTAASMSEATGIAPERINALLQQYMPEPAKAGEAIIPSEVASALQKAVADRAMIEPSIVSRGSNWWKALVLMKKGFYYNIHNSFGDLQRWVGQFGPSMPFDLKNWKWAFDETQAAYKRQGSELWNHAHDRNIVRSGRTGVETSQINSAPQLQHLYEAGEQRFGTGRILAGIKKLIGIMPRFTTMREDMMRMYALKYNLDRVAQGAEPLSGVADIRGLQGLDTRTIRDLSGKEWQIDRSLEHITRESLFDYSDFTGPEDKWLRNGLMPFYSWAKKDLMFWPQLAAKAAEGAVPRGGVAASAAMKGFATVVGVSVAARVWNSYIMGDAEDKLPDYLRRGNHLILPDAQHFAETGQLRPKMSVDKATGNQRVGVIRMTDAADDFLAWTGTDGLAPDLKAVFDGRMSWHEYLTLRGEDAIFRDGVPLPSVVQKSAELSSPFIQAPLAAVGYKTFPRVLTEVPEGERRRATADALGVGDFPGADFLTGPPEKGVLNIPAQTGYRNQALNPYPTVLQGEDQALSKREQNINDITREIERIAGGASSANLEEGDRKSRVQQLMARRASLIADYQKRARRLVDLSSTYLPKR